MSWLFYAALAPGVYAVVNFIDKYILEKHIKDYRGMPIYSSIMAFVFGSVLWVITGFPTLNLTDTLLILLTGMLTVWGLSFYFKALSNDEASKIIILFQMVPVLTLVMAYMLLSENISSSQLIGFFLILFATIGISLEEERFSFKLSSVFMLILITDLFWASAYVLFKFVVDANSFSKVVSYESWGIAIGGLVLYMFFPTVRTAFVQTNKKVKKIALGFIMLNEGIFVLARLCTYLAISLGPVALVNVIGGTQVFFGVLYGWILTLLSPKIFQENISSKGLVKKIIMGALVFVGIWLIQN